MHDHEPEKRGNGLSRKRRVVAGAGSIPAGYIICYFLYHVFNMPEDTQFTIAVCCAIQSLTTVGSMCMSDIRSMILARYGGRRYADGTNGRPRA